MRRCANCGSENEPNSIFCGVCGNKLMHEEAQPKTAGNSTGCPRCGHNNQPGSAFCENCGNNLAGGNAGGSGGFVKSQNTSQNTALIVSLIVLGVVIIISVALLIFKFMPRKNEVNSGMNGENTGNEIVETQEELPSSYYIYKSNETWEDANRTALSRGGYIATVNDAREFYDLCNMADSNGIKVFWVGAKRRPDSSWENANWLDGKSMTYTRWFPGEPTYYAEDGDDEIYLMVFNVDGEWYFNDAINDVSRYYNGRMGYIVEVKE